ncbi:hypothetical protein ACO0LG_16565 [Undibacterium sp. Ji42W]|uniref:hypothetical protein n=1 Tax=Undibacterium sp. Ji42W TaxID=3413039 RepID=UPI003BF02147
MPSPYCMIFVRLDAMQLSWFASFFLLIKRHVYLIAIWAGITWFCCQDYFGFVIYLLALPGVLYAFIKCVFNWRTGELRNKYILCVVMIVLAFTTITVLHQYKDDEARVYADHIVGELEQYYKLHGKLPLSLNDIPALATQGKPFHMLFYMNEKNGPFLFYATSFAPFLGWNYDFEKKQWLYQHD